jgi:energy-coupling factor transporter ATP-binding protein EcfA2
LSFAYATRIKPALVDLSFGVNPGETLLVLGPSGSGKSTLTLCLDGLIPHLVEGYYSGQAVVAGLVVGDSPVHVLAQETGLVFQDPDAQFCTLTVEDEIAFGLENLCRAPEEIEGAIDRSLDSVGLGGYRRRSLATLSGGEKQRVALAAVLAMGPRILVLDEPSANLDPRATSELFALLRGLAAGRRHTIVIIEHKLDELIEWIDSVLVLDPEGSLLCRGDPRAVFYGHGAALSAAGVWLPQTVELVAGLREAGWGVAGSPLDVGDTVAALAATPGLMDRLRRYDPRAAGGASDPSGGASGPAGGALDPPGRVAQSEALLSTRGLTFRYPNGRPSPEALSDVTMSLRRGGFLAIAGANGAGKSTLAALLTGVLQPPRDSVFLEGRDIAEMGGPAVSDRVGHVFQNPEHQFVSDTVLGELAYSLSPRAGRKGARYLTASQRELAEAWLDRLGLLALAEANPFSLSQGQKRRLSVAALLIRGQSALVLDEPTLGQDESQAGRLMAMMQEFRAGGGTVAMITHDMRLVSEYADSLLVLAGGRGVYAGTPADFFSRPALVEASGLAVPVLGRVCAGLREEAGTPEDLLTVPAFLEAAGACRGAARSGDER